MQSLPPANKKQLEGTVTAFTFEEKIEHIILTSASLPFKFPCNIMQVFMKVEFFKDFPEEFPKFCTLI